MKTVIIHGRRVGSADPLAGRDCELWTPGRNAGMNWGGTLAGWTRLFDAHPLDETDFHRGIIRGRFPSWKYYLGAKATDRHRTIYLVERHPEVQLSEAYPLAWVCQQVDEPEGRITTEPDKMLALAIAEGFERIILNNLGVFIEHNLRWQAVHQGIHFWIGKARGRGIIIEVEGPSLYTVGKHAYGYGPSRYGHLAKPSHVTAAAAAEENRVRERTAHGGEAMVDA